MLESQRKPATAGIISPCSLRGLDKSLGAGPSSWGPPPILAGDGVGWVGDVEQVAHQTGLSIYGTRPISSWELCVCVSEGGSGGSGCWIKQMGHQQGLWWETKLILLSICFS